MILFLIMTRVNGTAFGENEQKLHLFRRGGVSINVLLPMWTKLEKLKRNYLKLPHEITAGVFSCQGCRPDWKVCFCARKIFFLPEFFIEGVICQHLAHGTPAMSRQCLRPVA